MSTVILKFGGAAVASPDHFAKIAGIILDRKKTFSSVAVVVSAMANYTNMLINLALQVNPNPPSREYDMLVSVGERISIALLAMALAKRGEQAVSFTGSQSGIITCEKHSDAKIVAVKPHRLLPVLESGKVVIVAGFQGCSRKGEITTLGQNGSDISAVALAVALRAEKVEFYKDVEGIFEQDPKVNPQSKKFESLSFDDAIALVREGGRILHARCIQMAKKNSLPLEIRSFHNPERGGTTIFDPGCTLSINPQYELL